MEGQVSENEEFNASRGWFQRFKLNAASADTVAANFIPAIRVTDNMGRGYRKCN
jgi:hypothetical protein